MSPVTPETTVHDVVLKDGSTVAVRTALPRDVPALLAFFNSLSPSSLHYRFFGTLTVDRDFVARLLPQDDDAGCALVAESRGQIVAFAGYVRQSAGGHASPRAEVAFAVIDALQGRGLGTRLLEQLAAAARDRGIHVFDACVLSDNRRMMDVFTDSGFTVSSRMANGMFHVELSLDATRRAADQAARRSQVAATASMKAFFEPRAVAVVGANRARGQIGSELLHNLLQAGFTGRVIPVHPEAADIQGLRTCARVTDIPGPVDLAVIVVPATQVLSAVDDCLAKGVPALCVISAGFSESGAAGRQRERELLERVRAAGCRLIGPNCMGLINTDPAFNLNATFSPVYPPAGGVAMSTQSGALGLAILDYARSLNLGISSFVSVGNKADVSGNDLIQYWAEDPRTSVILLYLESFGNPKKFSEIARRVGRTKPIVAVKSGRSRAGVRAAASHTGALASSDAMVDALFRQSGVIRTDTLAELFDVANLLVHQPVPRGRRVAILTNAGGPGILAADACEAHGLELPSLSDSTVRELRSFLPEAASVANPVDMIASATADHYQRTLEALLEDDQVDSVLVIFIPPLVTLSSSVAQAIAEGARRANGKPVLGVFMKSGDAPAGLAGIPSFAFPEPAAIALARAAAYGEWLRRPAGEIRALDRLNPDAARQVVEAVLARGGGWLTSEEADRLMAAAGIEVAAARRASTPDEAVAAARALGFPAVVKAVGPALLHKTERKAVCLNLADEAAVEAAAADLLTRLGGEGAALLVQPMVGEGVEMLVGALHDPMFGPVVVCGSGGVLVDLVADSAFRLHPLTAADAAGMIGELRSARLLRGYRGAPPLDEAALRDVVLRVSALVGLCPEIQELDLNPVKVLSSGARAVDVRVRVGGDAPGHQTRKVEY
jgi:acetyl coenzyme A synthetase (ADP forming)-like protein